MKRRTLLTGLAALGCTAAASPFLTPVAFASASFDNRLVVLVLRGGMDGMDAIRPLGDPDYAKLRQTLNGDKPAWVDGFWGFHPALAPLSPLWQSGEFGAMQAVSTPYRDKRSHFDGQDILEAGSMDVMNIRDGWLNRMMQTLPGMTGETAYALGREQMTILTGDAPVSRWSPESTLEMSPQAERLLDLVLHNDPLFRDASGQALAIVKSLAQDQQMTDGIPSEADVAAMSETALRGDHVALAQFAASRLKRDTRIASFSVNGWDTHSNQVGGLGRALDRLSDTILTLKAELGPVWDKTAVLCLTEFGRTARENGTKGTDHGTAGAMLYAGGAMRGGQVAGVWPGLAEADLYDRRDLMPTMDVRAAASWVMRDLFGLDRSVLEQTVFPGMQLGDNPGLVL